MGFKWADAQGDELMTIFGSKRVTPKKCDAQNRRILREFPWLWCLKQDWYLANDVIYIKNAEEFSGCLSMPITDSKICALAIFCDGIYGEEAEVGQHHRCIILQRDPSAMNWATLASQARPRGNNIAAMAALFEDKHIEVFRPKSSRFYLTHACDDISRI